MVGKENRVAESLPEDDRLKALIKTALIEVLEERRDLLREVIEETLEDIALAHAIEAGLCYPAIQDGQVNK
jgi:hypothetical protein